MNDKESRFDRVVRESQRIGRGAEHLGLESSEVADFVEECLLGSRQLLAAVDEGLIRPEEAAAGLADRYHRWLQDRSLHQRLSMDDWDNYINTVTRILGGP